MMAAANEPASNVENPRCEMALPRKKVTASAERVVTKREALWMEPTPNGNVTAQIPKGRAKLRPIYRDAWIEAGWRAREMAYAPYSKFAVGAALLAENGAVFPGCNVENISYGLTNCAERVAIGAAIAAGVTKFSAVAVVAD